MGNAGARMSGPGNGDASPERRSRLRLWTSGARAIRASQVLNLLVVPTALWSAVRLRRQNQVSGISCHPGKEISNDQFEVLYHPGGGGGCPGHGQRRRTGSRADHGRADAKADRAAPDESPATRKQAGGRRQLRPAGGRHRQPRASGCPELQPVAPDGRLHRRLERRVQDPERRR